jgi:hypothetical protein
VGEEEEGKLKRLGAIFLVVLRHFDMVFSTDACAVQCGSAIRAHSIANRLEFDSEPYLSFFLSFFLSSFLFFGISISVGVLALALASGGDIDIESGKKVETRQDISMHAQEEEGKTQVRMGSRSI